MLRRRILSIVPVILCATFIVFGLIKLVPGDLAVTLAGDNATDARITEIREQYGLNRPFVVQYGSWLYHAVQGDLGTSLLTREPVLESMARRFPNTLLVVFLSLCLSLLVGIPLGIWAATHEGKWVDNLVSSFSSLGVAVPNFWLAMILVSVFAVSWNWFPATGSKLLTEDPWEALRYAGLPALALACGGIAEVARQLRGSLIGILSSQYVRTLHAKGLSMTAILWRHGLKNVAVNLLTVIGLLFNRLLGATVVVEAVFAIPGTGSLIIHAAIVKDYPVVQGVVLGMVMMVIAINTTIDVLYTLVDPRVRQK